MAISTADIKKLREATGAGMTDCKNALVEAEGDYDKAVEQLRIKGLKGVAKREGRAASNGLVIAKLDGTTSGTLLELNCETDFVAKSAKFGELASSSRSCSGLPSTEIAAASLARCCAAAPTTRSASSWNRSPFATKSVSQLSSSSVPFFVPSSLAAISPLLAARPSRFATPFRPLMRRNSTALS